MPSGKKPFIFNDDQIGFVKENYLIMSCKDIAKKLGIDYGVVKRLYGRQGLFVSKEIVFKLRGAKMLGKTNITAEDDAYITANYITMSFAAIGTVLGRADSVISNRVKRLGLIIPDEVMQKRIMDSRRKKGDIPQNKGKKQTDYMSAEQIAKTAGTRFKKGNLPYNTKEADGEITIRHNHKERDSRPYKFIRLSLGKWDMLHKVNWIKINGEVPKGHCLWCIDDDSLNCDPSNWELVTRAENILRNSGARNLPDKMIASYLSTKSRVPDRDLKQDILNNHPELIEIKRQELLLNRAIKQQENGKSTGTGNRLANS